LVSRGRLAISVFNAPDADIEAIYRAQYWNAVSADSLYDGLDLVMVDSGWGSGPVTAAEWLQRLLGVEVDGHIGVMTLAAVKARWDSPDLIDALCQRRLTFFQSLNTWRWFGSGWIVRLNGIHAKAMAMNAAARAAVPIA
jgi:lysozyme family protein